MAKETPRLKITYPALGESNYFDNYQAGMNDIDAGIFAAWSAINTIVSGGGTVTWDLVGSDYTLTWTSAIAFHTPAFGSTQSVASDSIIIPQGLLIYTDLSFGATVGSTALTFTVASQSPVDTASNVFAWHNPTTNQLHFATGLVLALGDTATGVQPQGGGGGSVSVTDGTTTVNPTTAIDFTAGAVVTDGGGGTAEVLIPLTTKFVVSLAGDTNYSTIQSAINAANTAVIATGRHQVVYIRPGSYTENLTIREGLKIVGQANPQSKEIRSAYTQNPAAYVRVTGNHTFAATRAVVAFHGISFVSNNVAAHLFTYLDNGGATHNTIQFYDCSLSFYSPDANKSLFSDDSPDTDNTRYYFERCLFRYTDGLVASGYPMLFIGNTVDFVECEFDTKGYGATIYLDQNAGLSVQATFTRCILTVCEVASGFYYGSAGIVTYSGTTHTGPDRFCIDQDAGGDVVISNSTCISSSGYPVARGNAVGTFYYDRSSFAPQSPISQNYPTSEAVSKISYDQVEGSYVLVSSSGTTDLTGRYDITTVSVDTSSAGATVTIDLPDASKTLGTMFTVYDASGSAGAHNIDVVSTITAGGTVGPHTSIVHNGGSLTFVATRDASSNDYVWRSISYFH